MVVKHNQRSTWTRPLRELRDATLGGRCGETMELEGRDSTSNTLPHLSRHPNGIHVKERFWFKECRIQVRRYVTTQHSWSMQLRGSTSRTERVRPKVGKERVYFHCMIRWDGKEMLSIYSGCAEYILPVTLTTSMTPEFPYTCHWSSRISVSNGCG